MSSLNGFSVNVPQAQEETSEGYIVLKHGQNFSLRLHNSHKLSGLFVPADAEVWVQGKIVGTFRVPANQTVTIEHPVNDSGKFAAYKNGSTEANQIGLDPESEDNGLIKVIWKPGSQPTTTVQTIWPYTYIDKYNEWHDKMLFDFDNYRDDGHYYSTKTSDRSYDINATYGIGQYTLRSCVTSSCCSSNDNLSGGGVGLSGHSNQHFSECSQLEYNEPETVIYLRIAFRDSEPRPITSNPVYKVHSTNVPRRLH